MAKHPARRRRRLLAGAALCAVAPAGRALPPAAAGAAARRTLRASDGTTLSYVDGGSAGAAGAPALLFVPGWCMPAAIWQPQLVALGGRYRTIALDPRGQGESEIASGGYTADRRAADIAEVIAGVSAPPGRVVLVAWSLAVLETLQLVYRFGAGALAAVVLVDNSVGEPPPPQPTDFLERLRADRRATVERFVRAMFAHPQREDEIATLIDGALRMPLAASIALLSYPFPREHWRAIARALPVPLAYLVGPRLAAQARSLAEHRPGTRTEVFADAGHALFVDEADRFNTIVDAVARAVAPK